MIVQPPNPPEYERAIIREIMHPSVADNPLAFVRMVFPWGKAGTFLHDSKEPRRWQCEEFERLGDHIQIQQRAMARGAQPQMYKRAICSGHGTGKGAFWAMLGHWFFSTRWGGSIIDTANTDEQLETRLWAEGDKWFQAARNKHWFEFRLSALHILPAPWFKAELEADNIACGYYYHRGQMYKPGVPDSWPGVHNPRGLLLGFDEASGVPPFVGKTSQGFFTGPVLDRYWFQFSQGRHLSGFFHESFEEDSDWSTRHLNSLEVEGTDKEYLLGIIRKYGENSYEARVMVFGLFPDQEEDQFIPTSLVEGAMKRQWTREHELAARWEQVVMACDPSYGGKDKFVIGIRRGFDFRSVPMMVSKGSDPTQVADRIVKEFRLADPKPSVIVIDSSGLGLGVYKRVKALLKRNKSVTVIGVNLGAESEDPAWKDKRTELYARTRDWLDTGFLPNDKELKRDLTAPKIERLDSGKEKLESKRVLRRKGLPSPDKGDVVALSMEAPEVKLDPKRDRDDDDRPKRAKNTDYDAINGIPNRRAA